MGLNLPVVLWKLSQVKTMGKQKADKYKGEGLCYEAAMVLARQMRGDGEVWVVHGMVKGGGTVHCHAWVEWQGQPDMPLLVLDASLDYKGMGEPLKTMALLRDSYYELGQVHDVTRYTPEEHAKLILQTGHSGPWEDRYYEVTPWAEEAQEALDELDREEHESEAA